MQDLKSERVRKSEIIAVSIYTKQYSSSLVYLLNLAGFRVCKAILLGRGSLQIVSFTDHINSVHKCNDNFRTY